MNKRILVALASVLALPLFAQEQLRTVSAFRHSIIADGVAFENLVMADIDGLPGLEAISCGAGAPFAAGYRNGTYGPVWRGPYAACAGVAAGDRDGDGVVEIITVSSATNSGKVEVFDPRSVGGAIATVTLPAAATDVAIGNVDLDAAQEIVVATAGATYVYDAATLVVEWTATSYGGTHVRIGDIDGDTQKEIVVNGSTGHILDAGTRTLKWGYVGGFGRSMALGNLDADAKDEIAFLKNWTSSVSILHGDTFATTTVTAQDALDAIGIGDANGDGANEILAGNNQWGDIAGYRPSDSALLWSVHNPEHGSQGVAAGDVDGDGKPEILWGSGASSSGDDALFIADPITKTTKWRSDDLDGPFQIAAGDLDGDGRSEYVVATYSSASGYDGGIVEVFDGATGRSKGKLATGNQYSSGIEVVRVAIGQLDADPAKEIVILGDYWYDPTLIVWDGVTHAMEWSYSMDGFNGPGFLISSLLVANVDGDPVDEIVLGMEDQKVIVLNGGSNIIQNSVPITGYVTRFAFADLDGDNKNEIIAISDSTRITVISTTSWSVVTSITQSSYASELAATSANGGMVAVIGDGKLVTYSGTTLTPRWTCTAPSSASYPRTVAFAPFGGTTHLFTTAADGMLRAYPLGGNSCPTPLATPLASASDSSSLVVADATGDGRPDLLMGTYRSAEVILYGSSSEVTGDVNGDSVVSVADIDRTVDYVLDGAPGLSPAGDVSTDGRIDIADAYAMIRTTFGTTPSHGAALLAIGSFASPSNMRVVVPVTTSSPVDGLAFRVTVTPANAVSNLTFVRHGSDAAAYERVVVNGNSVGYLGAFHADQGTRIGSIFLNVASGLPAGTKIQLTLDPLDTALSQRTTYNHLLALTHGTITIGGMGVATTLTSSQNPSTVGASVTFTAAVDPATSGNILFRNGDQILASVPLAAGKATFTTSALAAGTHPITATFEGTATHVQSTYAYLAQTVNAAAIAAPTGILATATSTSSVTINWNAVSGATSYVVYRSANGSGFLAAGTVSGTTLVDAGRAANTTYVYFVRAQTSAGALSGESTRDAATTVAFTHDPLFAGTPIFRTHLIELRTAANAMRAAAGLGAFAFTDAVPTYVRRLHIEELRSAINGARSMLGLYTIAFADATLPTGSTARATHVQQLRDAVK